MSCGNTLKCEPCRQTKNRVAVRRMRFWILCILLPLPAITTLATWLATGSGKLTIEFNWMFLFGSLGGMIAALISTGLASGHRRPLAAVDVIRIACWTIVGFSLGSGCGYNPVAAYMTMTGLAIIAVTVFFPCPAPPLDPALCCSGCGYNLTGNTTGVCPECGGHT